MHELWVWGVAGNGVIYVGTVVGRIGGAGGAM